MPKKKATSKKEIQTKIQLQEIKYCTGTNMKVSDDEGIIVMHSGSDISAYAFSMKHFIEFSEKLSSIITAKKASSKKK